MKFIIKETKEIKDLYKISDQGIDYSDDLIGNSGAVGDYITRRDDGLYEIGQDDFDWWEEYIDHLVEDEQELAALVEQYGSEEVEKVIHEYGLLDFSNDYDSHHRQMQDAISCIKDVLGAE